MEDSKLWQDWTQNQGPRLLLCTVLPRLFKLEIILFFKDYESNSQPL